MIDANLQAEQIEDAKLVKFNRAIDYHYEQILKEETFLEQVMMNYFPEFYNKVDSLTELHEEILQGCYDGHPIKIRYLSECSSEAVRRAEG